MSVYYGALAVGALGISNNIGVLVTSFCIGIQDAEASIVSQNIGNNQLKRARSAFHRALILGTSFGLIGMTVILIFLDPIIALFSAGNVEFEVVIRQIIRYEALAIPLLGLTSSCTGYLYGLGMTKLTMGINLMRLIVYRIPVLYILIHFSSLGVESIGIAMMISNILVGFTALFGVFLIDKEGIHKIFIFLQTITLSKGD